MRQNGRNGARTAESGLKRVYFTTASLVNYTACKRSLSLSPSFFLTLLLLLLLYKSGSPLISKHVIFFLSLPKGFCPHPPIFLTLSSTLPATKCQHSVKEAPRASPRRAAHTYCSEPFGFESLWVCWVDFEAEVSRGRRGDSALPAGVCSPV